MKINRIDKLLGLLLVTIAIFLFVNAPAPLKEETASQEKNISVNTLFEIVAGENNRVRKLWTQQIVSKGKTVGLKFDEDWQEKHIEAGPLPALFLREVATHLEKNPVPLSVFLGSDFPISSANKLKGRQAKFFEAIRETGKPQFFYAEDIKRYTAMFPDTVTVKSCATCHNEHKNSPKKDWRMNDIMGATTWAYPNEKLNQEELIETIAALRDSFRKAYESFIVKTQTYDNAPVIGEKWPSDGYFIPASEVFITHFEKEASANSMGLMLRNYGRQAQQNKRLNDVKSE